MKGVEGGGWGRETGEEGALEEGKELGRREGAFKEVGRGESDSTIFTI